jgi:hypothetical protein
VAQVGVDVFKLNLVQKLSTVRGGTVGSSSALQAGRSRVQIPVVTLEFLIDLILPAALWP